MAIKFTTTDQASKHVKILTYGASGIGKTRMCATAPKPIIISSEKKMMSLQEHKIPVVVVKSIQDFEDALNEVVLKKYKKYQTVCVDSISDIAEVAILNEKPNHNDPRKAYGIIQDKMYELLRDIRDNEDKHWYIIAKAKMVQNEDSVDRWMPMMPGKQMSPALPYLFDFVMPMRSSGDDDEDGYTYLQTNLLDDPKWDAKACSGNLSAREKPDLTKLFKKILKK